MDPNESSDNALTTFDLLLVEDSEDDAILIVEQLRLQGFQVRYDVADNPADFRQAIINHPYDAILCDHAMPQFSSLGALHILHELKMDIPFIIVSGVIGEDFAVAAMREGADDYVMKKTIKRLGFAIQNQVREALNRGKLRKADEELKLSEQAFKDLSEKLAEAVKARDRFIAIASHELRTPISVILLQMEVNLRKLTQGKISSLNTEYLKKVFERTFKQANSLAKLVDNLLSLSLANNSKIKINTVFNVDLHSLVEQGLEKILKDSFFTDETQNLVHLKPCEKALIVDVDPLKIEQVLNNLISNSLKYGDQKAVSLELSLNGTQWAEIRVTDQGGGIKEKDLDRIFQPFQRGLSTEDISGMGLGLFISREIMEAHQGSLSIESSSESGSVFLVRIPMAPLKSSAGPVIP